MLHRRNAARFGKVATRLILAVAVLAIAGAIVLLMLDRPAPNAANPGVTGLSVEELEAAVKKAQIAIGHLENGKFAEADQIFSDLQQKLPHEPLVARNLAVCRLLILENAKGEMTIESLQKSLDVLDKVEPESPVTSWLAARGRLKLYEKNIANESGKQHLDAALQHLRKATRLGPEDAAFWYQTYEACKDADDPAIKSEGLKALDEAHRIAPSNLRVAIEWLVSHTSSNDKELPNSLGSIRSLVEPFSARLQRRASVSVLDLLDQLKAAATNGQWPVAVARSKGFRNIVVSEEVTHSDERLVLKHPLEFVIYQFSQTVLQVLGDPTKGAREAPAIPVTFKPDWTDKPALAGVIDVEVADIDLDAKPELVVLKANAIEVMRLQPDGQVGDTFITVAVPEGMQHLQIADLDRDLVATAGSVKEAKKTPGAQSYFYDADPDLIVFGSGGIRAIKNQLADDGKRTFEIVPQDAAFDAIRNVVAGTLVDIDHEGDLDVVLSVDGRMQIWWNRDNLTFEDATGWSQLPPADLRVETLAIADWDRDVDVDVIVGGAGMQQSGLLENLRHGQVRWKPFDEQFADVAAASELTVWEADGNISWDLLAVGKQGVKSLLTTTVPAQSVARLRSSTLVEAGNRHASTIDYDNDGSLDVIVGGEGDATVFRGNHDGSLKAVTAGVLPNGTRFSRAVPVDVDNDGDLDLLALSDAGLSLLRNEGGNKNHWLSVRVRGEDAGKSGRVNHFGVGSMLELKTGQHYQAQVVQHQIVHFGLGGQESANVLRIAFTNGIPQSVVEPKANQLVSELMVNGTSCPFVYAWNGKQFEFVTDLLWNAPIGLQLADGVIAPHRPWEYLKIRSDQLVVRDGHYDLQVTAELWEADYFDQIELIAVDHPEDVEVFSNEKVGPAEIAEHKVHTVRARRLLAAARDPRGQDLLPKLARADGDMAVPFDKRFRKGRVEEHYVEVDFGKLNSPRRIMLYLTGWIQPGNTSLSVAASHNPDLPAGLPPSIWAPGADGHWKQTVSFMGFPGGKPKTIAVDVTNAFQTDDYRLRIVTNFELYWDEVFFTLDEEPADVKQNALSLVSADLHYRGFSATTPYDGPKHETYDYQVCDPAPRWAPMRGRFTRYGNVKDLLTGTDRRLAVSASGDEITLRFAALPPPPPGWKRDFLLHTVGWDKDADLNTVLGQTVEPLPFVGMPSYPYLSDPDESGSDPDFVRYLREYQTRENSRSLFWRP